MNRSTNSYPAFFIDEVSGIQLPDIGHKIWTEGHKTGMKDRRVIKSAIKAQNGMVLVFDEKGEQIPKYQGQYEKVKPHIFEQAPPSAVFGYALDGGTELRTVPREK